MIRYTTGNLLDAPVEALVNTVNTVGVMGKGIALMFKERFPANMRAYAEACKQGDVVTGKMFITQTGELLGPRWIVNFPTKQHWRNPAQMVWIQDGLQDLRAWLQAQQVSSIAIPPLGLATVVCLGQRSNRQLKRHWAIWISISCSMSPVANTKMWPSAAGWRS